MQDVKKGAHCGAPLEINVVDRSTLLCICRCRTDRWIGSNLGDNLRHRPR